MEETKRYIPSEIKLQVRKECGFGCVICGLPIFEYDHIEEFSVVKEHTVENLALLCSNHHTEKTTKKLSKDLVKYKRLNPFNRDKNNVSGLKFQPNKILNVIMGGTSMQTLTRYNHNFCCVWINGFSFFTIHFTDGWYSFSLCLTDRYGAVKLFVDNGELSFSKNIYDFQYISNKIKIQDESENVILEMTLSNYEINILEGVMIDIRSQDGVIFSNGVFYQILNNEIIGIQRNARISGGIGGVSLTNFEKFKYLIKPTGFGFSFAHGMLDSSKIRQGETFKSFYYEYLSGRAKILAFNVNLYNLIKSPLISTDFFYKTSNTYYSIMEFINTQNINFQLVNIEILETEIKVPQAPLVHDVQFSFKIAFNLKYNIDQEVVFVVCDVTITPDYDYELTLGKHCSSCVYKIENFKEYIDKNGKLILPESFINLIHADSYSTTRGLMFSIFKGTFLQGAIIPYIDSLQIKYNYD